MKKIVFAFIAAFMMTTTAYAGTTVFVNNSPVQYSDQEPVIINDRTYIPIRDVFETLGFKVDWNGEIKSVEISNDNYTTVLYTKTSGMFGTSSVMSPYYKKLENEIKIINGRTMLPLREILESMGYSLAWDAETKSTYVTDNNNYAYLNENKKALDALISGKKYYDTDTSALNADEKAFVENAVTLLENMPQAEYLAPEAAKAREDALVSLKTRIGSCPKSLKKCLRPPQRMLKCSQICMNKTAIVV